MTQQPGIQRLTVVVGRPHYPHLEAVVPAGPWRLQRSRSRTFRTIEHEVTGTGPVLVDDGPLGFGIPLDGRERFYRILRPDKTSVGPVRAVLFPHWTDQSPYAHQARNSGRRELVQAPAEVPSQRIPRMVYRDGVLEIWSVYGGRLCHPRLLRGLDLAELASLIYHRMIPPDERQRLDNRSFRRFPGMGYQGQLLEWLLDAAYRISKQRLDVIVGPESPLHGVKLGRRRLQHLIREGSLPGLRVRLEHWTPRLAPRVALDWSVARIHPDSWEPPQMAARKHVGISHPQAAQHVARHVPQSVTYAPYRTTRDPDAAVGTVQPELLGWKQARDILRVLLTPSDVEAGCTPLHEKSSQMVRRVADAAAKRLENKRQQLQQLEQQLRAAGQLPADHA